MRKGDILNLSITDYAFEGKGISKIDKDGKDEKKFVVFVNGGYPGDEIEAKITKIKKTFAEAVVGKVIKPSTDRTEHKCRYFGVCGGCKQQNMKYERQLYYKEAQVKDIFERLGGFYDFKLEPIEGSEKIFYYRNKME